MLKSAFTLIELVFAIVIIGISVLSLPMMNQVIANNIDKSLAQEAILIASTDITKIIAGPWDENSKDISSDYENVLITSSAEEAAFGSNNKRSGNINIIYNTDKSLRPTASGAFGLDTGETLNVPGTEYDIDDYITSTDTTAVSQSGESAGYKQQYTKEIIVTYPSSADTNLTSGINNVKKVLVNIKDENSARIVQLYTYEVNTGSTTNLPSRGL